jgi:hypothetical protein
MAIFNRPRVVSFRAQWILSWREFIRALQVVLVLPVNRACWILRASITRSRIWADDSLMNAFAHTQAQIQWLVMIKDEHLEQSFANFMKNG